MNLIRRWFARRRVRTLHSQAINMQETCASAHTALRSGTLPASVTPVAAQDVLRDMYAWAREKHDKLLAAEKRL